ncbi:MAG: hypothetical protein V3R98_00755 [Alphaproteobacteria bacterium]
MKSERLVVLVSPEEKARIVELAAKRRMSVGELVRLALSMVEGRNTRFALAADESGAARTPGQGLGERAAAAWRRDEPLAESMLSADQTAALERLADVAARSMARANTALDRAFEEVEVTKAYFADKRRSLEVPA